MANAETGFSWISIKVSDIILEGDAMPIYEFHCSECDHNFEEYTDLLFGEKCPECGSRKTEKLVPSSVVVHDSPNSLRRKRRGKGPEVVDFTTGKVVKDLEEIKSWKHMD